MVAVLLAMAIGYAEHAHCAVESASQFGCGAPGGVTCDADPLCATEVVCPSLDSINLTRISGLDAPQIAPCATSFLPTVVPALTDRAFAPVAAPTSSRPLYLSSREYLQTFRI